MIIFLLSNKTRGCKGFDCWIVQVRVAGGAVLTP